MISKDFGRHDSDFGNMTAGEVTFGRLDRLPLFIFVTVVVLRKRRSVRIIKDNLQISLDQQRNGKPFKQNSYLTY